MHIPIPHIGKRIEKRKASITEPVEVEHTAVIEDDPVGTTHHTAIDDTPHPIKLHKPKPKPKPKKAKREPKQTTRKLKVTSEEVNDPHPHPYPGLGFDLPPPLTQSTPHNNPNMIAAMQRSRSPTQEPNDINTNTPRRSSRIKDSMRKISTSWHKMRPYVERINGTIMPLEHQGTAAYYNRDGIKLDQRPTVEGQERMGGAV